jgi:hypothetical protein
MKSPARRSAAKKDALEPPRFPLLCSFYSRLAIRGTPIKNT